MKYKHAVVVGSGVAGAAVAEGLLEAGCPKVTVLEAGPSLEMRNRDVWRRFVADRSPPWRPYADPADDAEESKGPSPWSFRTTRLFVRGGTILLWGGWCLRFRPEDFELASRTGAGADWPIDYNELEPYYGMAERFLGVAGAPNPMSPPRSADHPLPPVPYSQVDGEVIRGCDKLGWSYGNMPIARYTEGMPGAAGVCVTTGTCAYCPVSGRYTPDQTFDRLAQKYPDGFELKLESPVKSLRMASKTEAGEVVYSHKGEELREEADLVVLAAGTIEVPKILQASTSTDWPDGVGNASDMLGRFLSTHPRIGLNCHRDTNPKKLQQELDFRTFMSRHFDGPDYQQSGKLFLFRSTRNPSVDLAGLIAEGKSRADIEAAVTGPYEIRLEGFMEEVPQRDSRVTLGEGVNALGLPKSHVHFVAEPGLEDKIDRRLADLRSLCEAMDYRVGEPVVDTARRGFHAIGTTRMSASDADGVVDDTLRVHGTDNVYVCSNAVFPSGGSVSPTLTLIALAKRLVQHLAKTEAQ